MDLIIVEVQFEHLSHLFEIVKSNPFLSVLLDQLKRLPPSFFTVWMSLSLSKKYDSFSQSSEEVLKANPFSLKRVCDIDERLVDELVSLIVAQSASCRDDFPDIGFPLIISIQIEQVEEVSDLRYIKGWVIDNNRFGEYCLPLVLNDSFPIDTHGYICLNII